MDNGASSYRRFLAGDKDAFAEVIDCYRESLIFFIYRYVSNIEIAEDLAEDTFVELIVHPGRFRFSGSLKTYLFAIARNKAVDHLKREQRIKLCDIEAASELADLKSLEQTILDSEEKRALNKAIGKINEDYRTALHLVYFEGMTYKDAARVMKKSSKQIENLVYRGKKALRILLEEEGIGNEK